MQIIDIHTHSKSGNEDYIELVSHFHRSPIPDTPWFSMGIHPWHADKTDINSLMDELHPKAYKAFAIGECGLDRASSVSWDTQTAVFKAQIDLSEKMGKPLIIHAVKAYPDIIAMHKIKRPKQAWIIHGYQGNQQIMEQCTDHGIYLSYGDKLMHGIESLETTLKANPAGLLFLETDESNIDIEKIYEQAARIRQTSTGDLAEQIHKNFKSIQNR
ncbi:MAG: TatD family hydrolase [Bacteroidales bacterium]